EAGHADVHQDDVRAEPLRLLHGLKSVARLADNLDIGLDLDDEPKALPHQGLVVREQDSDHRRSTSSGSRARTRKPPPSCGPASRSPPYSATRSRMPTSPGPWPTPFPALLPPRPSSTSSSPTESLP